MSALGDQLGLQLLHAAKLVEEQIDQEMSRMENLDEDDLEAIRRRRMEQLKQAQKDKNEMLVIGHGKYEELADEKEFFKATDKSANLVALFYIPGNMRCKIVDKHFEKLCVKHTGTRFVKCNAEKFHFLTQRLNIRVIPTIAIVKDKQTIDYIRGFDDMGGIDEFKTEALENRLAKSGIITVEKKKVDPRKKKTIRSCDLEYDNEEDW
ncbi:unnamed protein product [Auanema sp. JU1783]|nr:unnamed protein product [Auanema sp. JU1783]